MSIFANDDRDPITIDGQNIIYLRQEIDIGTEHKIADTLYQLRESITGQNAIGFTFGERLNALMAHTIVAWEGPMFADKRGKPTPCVAANILRMRLKDPLVMKVRDELVKRFPLQLNGEDGDEKKDGDDENTTDGAPSSTAD